MKFKRLSGGTLGLLAVGALAWGCSGKADDCNANLSCAPYGGDSTGGESGASGTGNSGHGGASGASGHSGTSGHSGNGGTTNASGAAGMSGEAGAAGSGTAACDGSLTPDADPCVINDEHGLFVSPDGDDATGDGSEAKPFATVTAALANVGKIKRIYVCAADYAEPSTLEIPDRVELYGGFSCAGGSWAYDSSDRANLFPASPFGAEIKAAKNGVTLQDVRIEAQDAPNGMGASSIGVLVTNSVGVVLTRVEIKAGKGGAGKVGDPGATGADGVASGVEQDGKPATCTNPPASRLGGTSITKVCGSQGGSGGTAFTATAYSALQDGAAGFLVDPTNGGKGAMTVGVQGTNGQPGANGAPGSLGALAPTVGSFSATGYAIASGGSGTIGQPGQGGGGGGSSLGKSTCVGASGGAGGMGGCGGDLGTGGGGGGASVALLSWKSTLTTDGCKLIASAGGAGAQGGVAHAGGTGKVGGLGGPADVTNGLAKGGSGGDGGDGGNGGSGSGGTGGPSMALVYNGTKPTQANPTFVHGVGGAAGPGGHLGVDSANWAFDGKVGAAQDEYAAP